MNRKQVRTIVTVAGFVLCVGLVSALAPTPARPYAFTPAQGLAQRRAELAQMQPTLVIIGHPRDIPLEIQELAGKQASGAIEILANRRAGSAYLYLALKNLVPPGVEVAVPFSGWQLTFAELYADSGRSEFEALAGGEEPEVERLAYLRGMPETEYLLRRHWGLYALRVPVQGQVQQVLTLKSLSRGADPAAAQRLAEYDRRVWRLARAADFGLLPHILRVARERGITLRLIEVPPLFEYDSQEQELAQAYRRRLTQYLREQGVSLQQAPSLTPELIRPVF